ncbi:hypothetical protein CIB84_016582 [Bambusicola thoracicus]|uniref:Uncharacterized protein n=1 Tax=Bambusicola thoracicus TaxID=9083 RepID=A0A2P4S6F1_BAMTH|nr:hypothetical protein CIB84_016582 [Bambusicola thoracicus]
MISSTFGSASPPWRLHSSLPSPAGVLQGSCSWISERHIRTGVFFSFPERKKAKALHLCLGICVGISMGQFSQVETLSFAH